MNQLKRRYATRFPWPRVLERRFGQQARQNADFSGQVTLLCIDAVREPLWVDWQGQRFCIVDAGYTWLQQFPTGSHHTVTTQFDADGQVVQWYIDICLQHGVSPEGLPWWDDLYLDILVFPKGECHVVDADELDDALQRGFINPVQHQLAWDEANRLMTAIGQQRFSLLSLSLSQRTQLLAELTHSACLSRCREGFTIQLSS
jgi:hypothetical protein